MPKFKIEFEAYPYNLTVWSVKSIQKLTTKECSHCTDGKKYTFNGKELIKEEDCPFCGGTMRMKTMISFFIPAEDRIVEVLPDIDENGKVTEIVYHLNNHYDSCDHYYDLMYEDNFWETEEECQQACDEMNKKAGWGTKYIEEKQ